MQDPVRITDYSTAFVHEFINRMEKALKGFRWVKTFYVFVDKRPGTIEEKLQRDAEDTTNFRR